MSDINFKKKFYRTQLRARRQALTNPFREKAAVSMTEQMLSVLSHARAIHIGTYHSLPEEMGTTYLINALMSLDKQVYLPTIIESPSPLLNFISINKKTHFSKNKYQIFEPEINDDNKLIKVSQLDALILPLVGFDLMGNRLGMGKGYYDRTLACCHPHPLLIGIGYACQTLNEVPHNEKDVKLSIIITESQTHYI